MTPPFLVKICDPTASEDGGRGVRTKVRAEEIRNGKREGEAASYGGVGYRQATGIQQRREHVMLQQERRQRGV